MTEHCSKLPQAAIDGILLVNSNVILICNRCVNNNQRDVTLDILATVRTENILQSSMENIEKRITAFEERVSQENVSIEKLIEDQTTSISGIAPSFKEALVKDLVDRQTPQQAPRQSPDNCTIRIKNLGETGLTNEQKLTNDETEVTKIFDHLGVKCGITNMRRMKKGKPTDGNNHPDTLLVTIDNYWNVRKIFAKLGKLKEYEQQIYISRELTYEERTQESASLKLRRERITGGWDRKNLRIRNLKLEKFEENAWTPEN